MELLFKHFRRLVSRDEIRGAHNDCRHAADANSSHALTPSRQADDGPRKHVQIWPSVALRPDDLKNFVISVAHRAGAS